MIIQFLIAKVPRMLWLMHYPDSLMITLLNYSNVKALWTLLGLKFGVALWLLMRLTRNFSSCVRMFNSNLSCILSILGLVPFYAGRVKLWWAMIPSSEDTFLDFFTIVLWGVILVSMLPVTGFRPCFTGRVFLKMLSSGFVNVLSVNAAKLTILLILGFCNRCQYRSCLELFDIWRPN